MNAWESLALVTGGIFAGSVVAFAWERIPAWHAMSLPQFLADFTRTIRRADRVQPALLVASIVSAVGLGLTAGGSVRTVALIGATGFMVTLVASGAVLVPLQRRIVASSVQGDEPIEAMKHRWFRGHLARSFVAVASFTLVAVAAAM